MTTANYQSLLEAITETRSDVNDVRRELLSRLDKIDERLRLVEIDQARTTEQSDISNKWKATIAAAIATAIAAIYQSLQTK